MSSAQPFHIYKYIQHNGFFGKLGTNEKKNTKKIVYFRLLSFAHPHNELNRVWGQWAFEVKFIGFYLPPNMFGTQIVCDLLCLHQAQVPTPTNIAPNPCKWPRGGPFVENIRDPVERKSEWIFTIHARSSLLMHICVNSTYQLKCLIQISIDIKELTNVSGQCNGQLRWFVILVIVVGQFSNQKIHALQNGRTFQIDHAAKEHLIGSRHIVQPREIVQNAFSFLWWLRWWR